MNECVFCKIANGELPSTKIFEDENTYAFLDIRPNNPGHTLIVSKKHYKNIFDAAQESLCDLIRTAKKITPAIKAGVSADGINIAMNNERAAGQIVDHIHMHIIPRFLNDGYKHWGHKPYKEGEMEEVAERIKSAL